MATNNTQTSNENNAPELPSRIPSLDGLRAISIIAVVIGHIADTKGFPIKVHGLEHLGNFGVKVFFIISGFLITTLLLKERNKTSDISLKKFYLRRAIRIFPAFYAYILAMVVAQQLGFIEIPSGDLLHALTYTMNYHHKRGWHLNHLWSLSVEEQFYLVWPALVAFSGPKRGVKIAGAAIVLAPIIRFIMWRMDAPASAFTREFQAVADVLATGCVLAGAYNWLGRQRWYMAILKSPLFLALPAILLGASFASYFVKPILFYIIGQSVSNIAMALVIDRSVRFPDTISGKLLNWKPIAFIGLLSYSLYLWQEPFLDPTAESWAASFPQNVALVAVASLASYYLVEKTLLRLRHRFAV